MRRWLSMLFIVHSTSVYADNPLAVSPLQGALQGQTRAGIVDAPNGISRDHYWTTKLLMKSNASLWDPQLLKAAFSGSIGTLQNRVVSESQKSTTRGLPVEYDLSMRGFEKSSTPIGLYGSRSQQVNRMNFGGLSRLTSEGFGGSFEWKNKTLSPSLSASRLHTHESLRQGVTGEVQRTGQLSNRASAGLSRTGPSTRLESRYAFTSTSDDIDPLRSFRAHDVNALHTAGRDNRFSTTFSYNSRGPFLTQSRLRAAEDVSLDHSPTFATQYGYSFDRTASEDSASAIHLGRAGLTHRLFGSLTEQLNFSGLRQRFSGGEETAAAAAGRLAYRKQAGPGHILLSAGPGYRRATRNAEPKPIRSIFEPHTMEDGLPTALDQRDADPESLLILDSDGTILYERGFDYDWSVTDNRVQFVRLPGGRIKDGEEVRVTYTYLVPGSARYDQRSFDYEAGYDLEWIKVFFRESRTRQNSLEGLIFESHSHATSAGAEGRYEYGPLSVAPEAERRGSRIDSISSVAYLFRQPFTVTGPSQSSFQITLDEVFFDARGGRDFTSYSAELAVAASLGSWSIRPGTQYWLRKMDGFERLWSNHVDVTVRLGKFESSLGTDYNRWSIHQAGRRELRGDFALTRWF